EILRHVAKKRRSQPGSGVLPGATPAPMKPAKRLIRSGARICTRSSINKNRRYTMQLVITDHEESGLIDSRHHFCLAADSGARRAAARASRHRLCSDVGTGFLG